MEAIECPYCGSENVDYVPRAGLYQCADCGEYFEDNVPEVEHIEREERTKLRRED